MSERKLRIGVAGATGAVGREIVALLNKIDLPIGQVVPMASPASKTHTLEVGAKNERVENMLPELVATCDLMFFAIPSDVATEPIQQAMDEGVPVIDLTGTLGPKQGVPLVVPSANRMDLEGYREHQAVASPRPDVVSLVTLLAPVRAHVGDLRCRGTIMHSAACAGRGGVEELSNQVVSLFNNRSPQRTVFPDGLAFDLEPVIGEVGSGGWTSHEQRCALHTAGMLRVPIERFALTSIIAPWFNGICFALQLETDAGLDAERLAEILADAPGVSIVKGTTVGDLPRPRSADGALALQVGRLRDDPAGGAIHLWAVADELRFGAAGNAVSLLAALIEDDLI